MVSKESMLLEPKHSDGDAEGYETCNAQRDEDISGYQSQYGDKSHQYTGYNDDSVLKRRRARRV